MSDAMRAWWVSDYEVYCGRSAEEAFAAATEDWGGPSDAISETLADVREVGPNETMQHEERGAINIRAFAQEFDRPMFLCGID